MDYRTKTVMYKLDTKREILELKEKQLAYELSDDLLYEILQEEKERSSESKKPII